MLEKAKAFLSLLAGWLAAAALGLFWLLSRRRSVPTTPHIVPKAVPTSDAEVLEEARREGIIR